MQQAPGENLQHAKAPVDVYVRCCGCCGACAGDGAGERRAVPAGDAPHNGPRDYDASRSPALAADDATDDDDRVAIEPDVSRNRAGR